VELLLAKAHAYGNDFIYLESADLARADGPELARMLCERHTGVGADGLILFRQTSSGAVMRLYNADGSPSEVSGNGVRGLAALLCWRTRQHGTAAPGTLAIGTDAGVKVVSVLEAVPPRFLCRSAMGQPAGLRRETLEVAGDSVAVVTLRVGNPQCVVLESRLDEARYRRLGPALERHAAFPEGTNVEFAAVEGPRRVRVLIWERGVGPTRSSGTGACAAAVAAMAYAGVERDAEIVSPGGAQHVEWNESGLFLTGWADMVWEGRWIR